jgi:potassium efflux system protein
MMKTARLLLAALALTGLGLAAPLVPEAWAQTSAAPDAPAVDIGARIDQLGAALANVEKNLKTTKPGQAALDEMRQTVKPIAGESQALVDRLTPGIAALKARLDQLGPKPAANAPAEPPEIIKERTTAQTAYDNANGLLKRAKLLATEAEQDDYFLSVRQRAAFNRDLFQRETSLLNPPLWFGIVSETPDNLHRFMQILAGWAEGFDANLTGVKPFLFWGGATAILLLYWPLMGLARRVLPRDPTAKPPSRWRKVLLACWVSLSLPAVLIGLMYGIAFLCAFFAVPDTRLQSLFAAVQGGVIRIAVAAGLTRGILSPGSETWRLSRLDSKTCGKLIRITVAVAAIVSGTRIFEALNDAVNASLPFSVAARGVGALLVAVAIAAALYSLGGRPREDREEAGEPAAPHEWSGLIRGIAWTVVLAITAAVLTGYIALGNFLVEQIVLVAGTGAIFFLAVSFVDEACAAGFHPNTLLGRSLVYSIGLRREGLEQLAILLSGVIRLVLITVATLAVMVPWGLQSNDIPSNLYAIFFGFKIGDFTVSLAGIAFALLIFLAVIAATRGIQGWLENRYLPLTRLDSGLQNSIKTSLGYAGFLLALAVAAADLGVDFQKLAIVAGALSVGIGFGLQSIVNNFVSGLILLWERAVRVGDWIVVGSDQGYVRRINVRSTEIETFDRASVIIPNSNLVSGVVKNLMRADKVGRLMIEVTVNRAASPESVREVLLGIARNQDGVLTMPSPQVRFTNLTATAMNFELYCFVADVESVLRTKSDLYFEIHKQFGEHGFFNAPAPDPLAIKIEDLDRLETMLHDARGSSQTPPAPKAASANPDV